MKNPPFDPHDPLLLNEQLSNEEKLIQKSTREYAQSSLLPNVIEAARHEISDVQVIRDMGELGLFSLLIPEKYGGSEGTYVSYGLVAQELEKIDSAYRSTMSVQSCLGINSVFAYGNEQQRSKYLPDMIKGKLVACFGLTEPDSGSDPGSMSTWAEKTPKGFILRGSKMWISNSPLADVLIVWAKSPAHDNKIRGFIVDRDTNGIETPVVKGKLSLRASSTGEIVLNDALVPESSLLPHAQGLSGPFGSLNKARFSIAWGALGTAYSCWLIAKDYCLNRKQFNRPLAANQLIQLKLSNMLSEIAIGQQACLRVAKLLDQGTCPHENISLIKRNSSMKALQIARDARDMLGGNGIMDEYHVMRHLCNLETVITYEGTQDVHALILGKAQTGIQAFY